MKPPVIQTSPFAPLPQAPKGPKPSPGGLGAAFAAKIKQKPPGGR